MPTKPERGRKERDCSIPQCGHHQSLDFDDRAVEEEEEEEEEEDVEVDVEENEEDNNGDGDGESTEDDD
jgi:hypothetical protein